MSRWQKIGIGVAAGFIALLVLGVIVDNGKTKTTTRTVTSTVTTAAKSDVVKAPASCITALNLTVSAFRLVSDAASIYERQIAPAARAGVAGDAAGIRRATANMNRATAKINAATPIVRRAGPFAIACRASR
jgi:hypothetical protein